MNNNKNLSLSLLSLTLSLGIVNVDAASQFGMRRVTGSMPTAMQQAVPDFGVYEALRFCHSSNPFQGDFVKVMSDGHVSIHQPKYPTHKWFQSLIPPYRIVGEPTLVYNPDGTSACILNTETFPDAFIQLLDPLPTETIVNSDLPYEIITRSQTECAPHFSCGRLSMMFDTLPKGMNTYAGSAAAIDKNLLVTAAHNFLPPYISGVHNKHKLRANTVKFEHLLLGESDYKSSHHIHVASHCYMHPQWIDNFDPHYDIALVFLSECMQLTKEESDELLKLQILPETIKDSIRVIGYPKGFPSMKGSAGDLRDGENLSRVIYHSANTEPGSSGSPIVKDHKSIIGVHAYGSGMLGNVNTGVRIRESLLPFIDDSVRLNQLFLEDEERAMQEKDNMQKRWEYNKNQKIKEEGKIEGKIDMVKKMITQNMDSATIASISELSSDQIEEIRAGMASKVQ